MNGAWPKAVNTRLINSSDERVGLSRLASLTYWSYKDMFLSTCFSPHRMVLCIHDVMPGDKRRWKTGDPSAEQRRSVSFFCCRAEKLNIETFRVCLRHFKATNVTHLNARILPTHKMDSCIYIKISCLLVSVQYPFLLVKFFLQRPS